MGETEAGSTRDSKEPISGNTMNVTRVGGFAAVAATLGTVLVTIIGQLPDVRVAVVIALFASISVAMAAAAYVAVNDMRVRGREQVANLRIQGRQSPDPQRNGKGPSPQASGVPMKLVGADGALIGRLVPDHNGPTVPAFPTGNGPGSPESLEQYLIRQVLERT
jgi:hypothetical protein